MSTSRINDGHLSHYVLQVPTNFFFQLILPQLLPKLVMIQTENHNILLYIKRLCNVLNKNKSFPMSAPFSFELYGSKT